MFRKLATQFRRTAHRWSARPYWSASLGLLLFALITSGPLACVVHCALSDAAQHAIHSSHAGHHHHRGAQPAASNSAFSTSQVLLVVNESGDHALCEYVLGQTSEAAPSALTIGVVLVTILALPIVGVNFRYADRSPQLRRLALPPPLAPPRCAPGLA